MLQRRTSRRQLLAGIGGAAAALGLRPALASSARGGPLASTPPPGAAARVPGALPANHLAWVWQFNQDGEPEKIRDLLAGQGMGIALKTHDGVQWMSRYDTSRNAVSGPARIADLAAFFEAGGVPFHAWCVVRGLDPLQEAGMAASVLRAGARSLFIDLESYPGFWAGTREAAFIYMGTLRQAQPSATVIVTVDARPWEIDRIPLREFAAGAHALAPQVYWSDFATAPNIEKYRLAGADPGTGGVTPAFALDTATRKLAAFGLPIHPIGPGLVSDAKAWGQFVTESYARDAQTLSVWRLGTTVPAVFEVLRANPPRRRTYEVQPGDTLSALAHDWGTTVEEIARANEMRDINALIVGQSLVIPGGAPAAPAAAARPALTPVTSAAPASTPGTGVTYIVQAGDNLWALAARWGTTAQRIAQVNSLAAEEYLLVGQRIRIP